MYERTYTHVYVFVYTCRYIYTYVLCIHPHMYIYIESFIRGVVETELIARTLWVRSTDKWLTEVLDCQFIRSSYFFWI